MKKYYYCEDTRKYVMLDGFFYSLESDGSLKLNRYYDGILIGSVWAQEVTEEEFNRQLSQLKAS